MACFTRLLFTACILFAGNAPAALATESAVDELTNGCIECHQAGSKAHIHDWGQSVHARFGIACADCHAGNPSGGGAVQVYPDGRTAACRGEGDGEGVVAICGRCHEDVGRAFRGSPHFREAAGSKVTPTCVDCHSSAGGYVLSGDLIPRRCASCHSANGSAGKPWVAARALALLELLRKVTLARTIVEEQLDVVEGVGGDVAPFRGHLSKVDASSWDIPIEWHRFNLKDVDARSTSTLQTLELLHDRLERTLAAVKSEPQPLKLAPHEPFAPRAEGEPLRFAVASMLGPIATYDAYVGMFNDMARTLGRPYRMVQRRTYQEINELLLRGELDLAFICSGAYVALPENAPIEIIALPIVDGQSVYHSLIIVREDSRARGFQDLKGTRFAFADPLSNTGYLYPVFRLAELHQDPKSFFSSTFFSGSHDRSVFAVYRKLADAAAVDDLVFKQLMVPGSPYWGRLRVIETSPDFDIPPVVAPTSVPAELRAQMRRFLLELNKTPQGRKRLAALGFDGFTAGKDETYASIRRMVEATAEESQ